MMYKQCAKKFWYFYNDDEAYKGYNQVQGSDALIKGSLFHQYADTFFDNIGEPNDAYSPDFFREAVPVTKLEDLNKWLQWFANKEWERYEELNVAGQEDKFIPFAREEFVSMPDSIDRSGHFDRIDIIPGTRNLQIVEYKTGKSYDMDKTWAATSMNSEIGFYVIMLNTIKKYPDFKITEWKVINPTLETIWVNKISPISIKSVNTTYRALTQAVFNKGPFERNITMLCRYCPYIEDCLMGSDIDIDEELLKCL